MSSSFGVLFELMHDVKCTNKSWKRFTVSGRSKQASRQRNVHTHMCNEVMLA